MAESRRITGDQGSSANFFRARPAVWHNPKSVRTQGAPKPSVNVNVQDRTIQPRPGFGKLDPGNHAAQQKLVTPGRPSAPAGAMPSLGDTLQTILGMDDKSLSRSGRRAPKQVIEKLGRLQEHARNAIRCGNPGRPLSRGEVQRLGRDPYPITLKNQVNPQTGQHDVLVAHEISGKFYLHQHVNGKTRWAEIPAPVRSVR